MTKGEIGRIIVFRQGQFGDTLVAFPVIESLHHLYPEIPLVYCTNHFKSNKYVQGQDVAQLSPYIKGIITYNVEDPVTTKYIGLKKSLNVSKHDLLIYLPYSTVRRYQIVRDWVFFKALNFKHMICFKENWNWTYVYESKKCQLPKESERMLGFLRLAGIPVEFSGPCSVINCDKDWAERKWSEWGLTGKRVLAMCPGSKMQSKRWLMKRYIKVGCEWHKRTGMPLIIVGGPEEAELAGEIINHWRGYGFSVCGASLSQTAAILTRVEAYCGNDTGSMHLASVLGIPCVALFSARECPELWYPMGNNNIVLSSEVPCANCKLVQCYTSPPKCLELISVGQVLDALEKVWNA